MAREGESSVKAETAPDPDDPRKPENPTDMKKPSLMHALKSAVAEFNRDQCTDLAAALTYYSVLSIFPALLALTSIVGVFGDPEDTVQAVTELLRQAGQGDVAEELAGPIQSITQSPAAGFALVAGLLGAIWAASNYVNGFGRAMNRIYQVDEGRPIWKLRPQMLLVTIIMLLLAAIIVFSVVMSGEVARQVGSYIGLGDQTVMIWNIAKWPVILLLVVLAVAILYYATPNIQQPKFRWISVGAFVAILVWIAASVGFGFYVSNFGKYERTYGSLAGVIIFLLWLWLTNSVLLFGAEVDAELERSRQLQAGIKAEETLQLPPRDTRQSDKAAAALVERIEAGREIRKEARLRGETGHLAPAAGADNNDDKDGQGKDGKDGGSERVAARAATASDLTDDDRNVDPADRDLAEKILEPLPSERARLTGWAQSGARDSDRAARSGRDWSEEALERDVQVKRAQSEREKVAARAADDSDRIEAAKGSAGATAASEAAKHGGRLEPLPSEIARLKDR